MTRSRPDMREINGSFSHRSYTPPTPEGELASKPTNPVKKVAAGLATPDFRQNQRHPLRSGVATVDVDTRVE